MAGYVGVVVEQSQQDQSSPSHLDSATAPPEPHLLPAERSSRWRSKECRAETRLKEAQGMRQKQLVVRRVSFRSATSASY